jgi:fucokinase
MLGKLAGDAGGLRSGPANNLRWRKALQLVAAHPTQLHRGVAELALCRREWLAGMNPLNLVRAARHYERASQILIREAVMSARKFINVDIPDTASSNAATTTTTTTTTAAATDAAAVVDSANAGGAVGGGGGAAAAVDMQWTVVEASARIDLSGGWSDTPPIAYEHGGAVTNIAILVNGKRPIGVGVRRVPPSSSSSSSSALSSAPCLVLVVHSGSGEERVVVETMAQLQTYHQPQSPAALLKAAVCCARLVDEASPMPLAEQLRLRLGGCGLEMHSWSHLPSGSGLGTSSILAGCALAAVWAGGMRLAYDDSSVYHAVLHLEQMLTTGGGWQDQVGGIAPGMKLCQSQRGLPLRVLSQHVGVPDGFLTATLSAHLVLIYTGKTRLARDLLQNVLRNWYSLDPTIVDNVRGLVRNAHACAAAATRGDLAALGACVDQYWAQKKVMAPGCEPPVATKIMAVLRPMAHGLCMCGAGGGGFMYAVMKEPDMDDKVREVLGKHADLNSVRVYGCEVDCVGMKVRTLDAAAAVGLGVAAEGEAEDE